MPALAAKDKLTIHKIRFFVDLFPNTKGFYFFFHITCIFHHHQRAQKFDFIKNKHKEMRMKRRVTILKWNKKSN